MNTHEDITNFQIPFNGPFPFSTNGVVIGLPSVSFAEEMQTKITFPGGSIGVGTFHHENMHQWWGDNVSEDVYERTFFKEGYADLSEGYNTARTAANAAGGMGTPAGDAAFEASLANRFNTTYNSTSANNWNVAPSKPTNANLFGSQTYTRSGRAYIALRAILGPANFTGASKEIQTTYGGSSITQPQQIAIYKKWLPNQSPGLQEQARRVLPAVVGHRVQRLPRGRQQAADHGSRPRRPRLLRRQRRLRAVRRRRARRRRRRRSPRPSR